MTEEIYKKKWEALRELVVQFMIRKIGMNVFVEELYNIEQDMEDKIKRRLKKINRRLKIRI